MLQKKAITIIIRISGF